jgi:RimJ/RimL family protein N-acetyltransferase
MKQMTDTRLREATEADLYFLIEALHKTFLHLKACGKDPYNQGFTETITVEEMETYVREYLDGRKSKTYILHRQGTDIGCILGKIASSHLSASGVGLVGWIGLCYIDERFRGANLCAGMYDALRAWFASKTITIIELSYMAANGAAETTWKRLGFEPFRVVAYTKITDEAPQEVLVDTHSDMKDKA